MAGIFAVVVVAASYEWARIAGWKGSIQRAIYAALTLSILGASWLGMAPQSTLALAHSIGRELSGGIFERALVSGLASIVVALGLVWWLFALLKIVFIEWRGKPIRVELRSLVATLQVAIWGWFILVPAWVALVGLHRLGDGPSLVLTLFAVVWGADIGAYFVGRRFGRRRLASQVSPGKSWEGVGAGALLGIVAGVVVAVVTGLPIWAVIGFAAGAVVFSVVGDLLESVYKRQAGIKDSGSLLPGHGGVLDRIDSLTAAAPIYFAGVVWCTDLR